jgi:hypothetical protein
LPPRLARRQQIGALSEIVEQQRGKDHGEPADADRPGAEMPEVRVHGLAAGDDQHQRAEDEQRLARAGAREEANAMRRIERRQNRRLARDLGPAENGDRDEPDDQDRAENDADSRRALELDGEEPGQQREGDRRDIGREGGRRDVESFDRRQAR